MTDIELLVQDDPENNRFAITADGDHAGYAYYTLGDGTITFTHTEVETAFEGKGVGGVLARKSLDGVRAEGRRKVIAQCPFIKVWIERHPSYQDLLADPAAL